MAAGVEGEVEDGGEEDVVVVVVGPKTSVDVELEVVVYGSGPPGLEVVDARVELELVLELEDVSVLLELETELVLVSVDSYTTIVSDMKTDEPFSPATSDVVAILSGTGYELRLVE